MSRFLVKTLLAIFPASVVLVAIALSVGYRFGYPAVAYRVDGYPCALNWIDVHRRLILRTPSSAAAGCHGIFIWSPDGSRVAALENKTGTLLVASTLYGQPGEFQEVKGALARSGIMAWSPDAHQLAYLSTDKDITVIGVVGFQDEVAGAPRLFPIVGTEPIPYALPSWSPDGRFIAFAAYISPRNRWSQELFVLDVATGAVRRLTDNNCRNDMPSWSPDGALIAFTSAEDGYNEVHLLEVATGKRWQITHGVIGYEPVWSPDGAFLAFSSNRDIGSDLYLIRPDGSDLRRLTFEHNRNSIYPIW